MNLSKKSSLTTNAINYCFGVCVNYTKHELCEECYSKAMYVNYKCQFFVYKNKVRNKMILDMFKQNPKTICISCHHFIEHSCPIDSIEFIQALCKMQKMKFFKNKEEEKQKLIQNSSVELIE